MNRADQLFERLIDWTLAPDNIRAGIARMLLVIAAITIGVLLATAAVLYAIAAVAAGV